ncbi:MAG: hypothetical protein IJ589_08205 [Lachnospiraceae bacterium]|nr:hypothetical protein [Lachnospiraceae bacterium]
MEFQIIEIFNRTVTIELCSEEIYAQKEAYEILLDGEVLRKDDKNVVTIDGLEPDREYRLGIREANGTLWEQSFRTKRESVLLNVQTFGAKGDGVTDDTSALQTCLESCPADGTVYVPAGTYLTRPLFLKSNISCGWMREQLSLEIPTEAITASFPAWSAARMKRKSITLVPGRAILWTVLHP